MDRKERERPRSGQASQYANQSDVSEADRTLLETPAGRQDNRGLDEDAANTIAGDEIRGTPLGDMPRRAVTGAPEPGTEAETEDGLDDIEEAVRVAAEDTAVGDRDRDTPVFETSLTGPKV
jgi:hypothetical protein